MILNISKFYKYKNVFQTDLTLIYLFTRNVQDQFRQNHEEAIMSKNFDASI